MQFMQEHDTFPGKVYAVTCASGCTITDNKGRTLGECEAGKQALVVATSDKLLTSADALVTATFKLAPAKLMALGLLGGGAATPALPPGYLAAEFLESTGAQYIQTELMQSDADVYTLNMDNTTRQNYLFGARAAWNSRNIGLSYEPANKSWVVGWGNANSYSSNYSDSKNLQLEYKKGYFTVNGTTVTFATGTGVPIHPLTLFAVNQAGSPLLSNGVLIRHFQVTRGGEDRLDFMPAVDPGGVPCMYDKVSKQPFRNSGTGSFIVGFTLAQARQLSKLPSTGGTLTISLPTDYESDEGVAASLETARANGWTLTIQTYTPETVTVMARTFAFRRIWVRRTQNDNGTYVDASGSRWMVEWCVDILTPDGSTPDAHGYELFRSVEAAVAFWELTPWIDPETEKMMQDELLTTDTAND